MDFNRPAAITDKDRDSLTKYEAELAIRDDDG